jgi:hypothetical protein
VYCFVLLQADKWQEDVIKRIEVIPLVLTVEAAWREHKRDDLNALDYIFLPFICLQQNKTIHEMQQTSLAPVTSQTEQILYLLQYQCMQTLVAAALSRLLRARSTIF